MLGKTLTAILAMTAVLCCFADVDLENPGEMTEEKIAKIKEIWSNCKCNVTTNKTEDAIIANECIKTVTEKEPAVQITEENAHDLRTYLQCNLTKTEWKKVESCSIEKHGWDKEFSQKEATEFLQRNMTYADDDTRNKFRERIETCLDENKTKDEKARCGKEAFSEVCCNVTLPKDSPK